MHSVDQINKALGTELQQATYNSWFHVLSELKEIGDLPQAKKRKLSDGKWFL
jgi:hypothetical protein